MFKRALGAWLMAASLITLNSCTTVEEGHDRYELIFADSVDIHYSGEWQDRVYYDEIAEAEVLTMYLGCEYLDLDFDYTSKYDINTDNWVWTSSDESVVVVSPDGVVYPVGAGTATVAVNSAYCMTNSPQYAAVIVKVAPKFIPATAISVAPADPEVDYAYEGGYNIKLEAKITATATDPVAGSDVTYSSVVWSSSNPAIADIDRNSGLVTTGSIPELRDYVTVTFYAETIDGSEICEPIDVQIRKSVSPLTIDWDDATHALDGKVFSRSEDGFVIDYTMEPADATKGLIEWVSSDPSAVTIVDGVVTFVGYNDEVTLSATCSATGDSESITISVPAGFIRQTFESSDETMWDWGISTGSDAYQVWNESGFLNMYTYDASAINTQARSDFKCYNPDQLGFNATYPLFAIHMLDVLSIDAVNTRNIRPNINWQVNGEGDVYFYKGTNNKYAYYYELSDGTQMLVWDFKALVGAQSYWPVGNNVLIPTSFDIVYADMQTADPLMSAEELRAQGIDFPYPWELHSIQTFKTSDDVESYITNELGLTFEQVTLF